MFDLLSFNNIHSCYTKHQVYYSAYYETKIKSKSDTKIQHKNAEIKRSNLNILYFFFTVAIQIILCYSLTASRKEQTGFVENIWHWN